MATARKFEDLVAWQLCMELSDTVFSLTESGRCLKDQEFRKQIREAAENAPGLISEGFIRFTPAEFVRYLRMARGEIGEVQSRLVHAGSQKYFSDDHWRQATVLAERAMKVTTALLASKLPLLRKKNNTNGTARRKAGRQKPT